MLKEKKIGVYLLLLFLFAFWLRLVMASLVFFWAIPKGVFPDYYFSDSFHFHRKALILYQQGMDTAITNVSSPHLWYIRLTALLYRLFFPSYFLMMGINSLVSASLVFVIFYLAKQIFQKEKVGLLAASLYAFYPSLIFHGSSHMRDPWIALFSVSALFCLVSAYYAQGRGKKFFYFLLFLLFAKVAILLRPHLWYFFVLGIFGGGALLLWIRYPRVVSAVYFVLLVLLVFVAAEHMQKAVKKIVERRYSFMWTQINHPKSPKTVLFPKWKSYSFQDILLMEGKLVFYFLLMPFPLLYPIEGRKARLIAATEHVFFALFLVFALYGVYKAFREHDSLAGTLFVVGYLTAFIGIFAFFCPDLGSAVRYKLSYFPLLSIFVAKGMLELWEKYATSTS